MQAHTGPVRRLAAHGALGTAAALALTSSPALIAPAEAHAAAVALPTHPASVHAVYRLNGARPAGRFVLRGKAASGTRTTLQRRAGGHWQAITTGRAKAGAYVLVAKTVPEGRADYRVVVGSATSQPFTVRVDAPASVAWRSTKPQPWVPPTNLDVLRLSEVIALGERGVGMAAAITASGGTPPYTFRALSKAPSGLTLSPEGFWRGVPSRSGIWQFKVDVRDAAGKDAQGTYRMLVTEPLTLLPQRLPTATVGQPYTAVIRTVGGVRPTYWYGFDLFSDPPGLTIDLQTGVVRGTPTLRGTHVYDIRLTDPVTEGERFAELVLPVSPPRTKATTLRVPSRYPSISAAISAARDGDTVVVAPGTYSENLDFGGKNITVRSSRGAGRTIIDGGGQSRGLPVVSIVHNEASARLSGFTLRNGYARSSGSGTGSGGGVAILEASAVVSDNVVEDNVADGGGGGIYIGGGGSLVEHNVVRDNKQSGDSGGDGGGIDQFGDFSRVVGNDIYGNSWGAGRGFGGGLAMHAGVATGNRIHDNASGRGAGVEIGGFADFVGNLVYDNHGVASAVYLDGGDRLPTVIADNTVVDNDNAVLEIGATTSSTVISNDILAANPGSPLAVCQYPSQAAVLSHDDLTADGGPGALAAACGAVLHQGPGNTWDQPSFVNRAAHDYRPAAGSDLVDAGTNTFPYHWFSLPSKDFAGHRRLVDGNRDGKAVVDIGAYERQ